MDQELLSKDRSKYIDRTKLYVTNVVLIRLYGECDMTKRFFNYYDSTFYGTAAGKIFREDGTELSYAKKDNILNVNIRSNSNVVRVALHRLIAVLFLDAQNNQHIGFKDGNGHNTSVDNLILTERKTNVSNFPTEIQVIPEQFQEPVQAVVETVPDTIETESVPVNVVDDEMVTVTNGYGRLKVSRSEYENYPYYKKHGFKVV